VELIDVFLVRLLSYTFVSLLFFFVGVSLFSSEDIFLVFGFVFPFLFGGLSLSGFFLLRPPPPFRRSLLLASPLFPQILYTVPKLVFLLTPTLWSLQSLFPDARLLLFKPAGGYIVHSFSA